MVNKILKFCFILFLITGCSKSQKDYKHKRLLDIVTKQDPEEVFNDYWSVWIFLETNKEDTCGYIIMEGLQRLYVNTNKYKYLPYSKFITSIISGKLLADCNDMAGCFIPNDTILSFYQNNPLEVFLDKYTDKYTSRKEYRIKNIHPFHSVLTVMYCLYQSELYSMSDDYTGGYYSRPLEGWKSVYEDMEMISVEEE